MIDASILTMGSTFDLKTGKQANYMVFVLPDGSQHQAFVSEDTALNIIGLFVQGGGRPSGAVELPPIPKMEESAMWTKRPDPEEPEEEEHVFGGHEPPPPVQRAAPAPPPPPRPRVVGKDEAGNPILSYPNGVPTPQVYDDDGVAQA